jgi:acetolactate synthase small subunit
MRSFKKNHINLKTNDKCSVHKNQINFLINNINIKCVNSQYYEKHKDSRNFVINIIEINNIKNIKEINDNICKMNVNLKKNQRSSIKQCTKIFEKLSLMKFLFF